MKRQVIVSVISFFVFVFLLSSAEGIAHQKSGMMRQGHGPMMGGGTMGHGKMGYPGTSLKRILHLWIRLLFSQKDELGATEAQLDKIQSLINDHMKETIRMKAERRVIGIELRELLAKNELDLSEIEKRIKSMANLKAEMDLSGIRTFEKVKNVLSGEQRKKIHTLFKSSLFPMMDDSYSPCVMDERTGMGPAKGGMMKGMMGASMMQGQPQTGVSPSTLTKTDSQGPVTVKIAFDPSQRTGRRKLIFKVEMDTHSEELEDIDLGQLSVLRNEQGAQVNPSEWTSPGVGGHHVKGTLVFPNAYASGKPLVGSDTRYVELVVRDVGEVGERIFRWDLKQ